MRSGEAGRRAPIPGPDARPTGRCYLPWPFVRLSFSLLSIPFLPFRLPTEGRECAKRERLERNIGNLVASRHTTPSHEDEGIDRSRTFRSLISWPLQDLVPPRGAPALPSPRYLTLLTLHHSPPVSRLLRSLPRPSSHPPPPPPPTVTPTTATARCCPGPPGLRARATAASAAPPPPPAPSALPRRAEVGPTPPPPSSAGSLSPSLPPHWPRATRAEITSAPCPSPSRGSRARSRSTARQFTNFRGLTPHRPSRPSRWSRLPESRPSQPIRGTF